MNSLSSPTSAVAIATGENLPPVNIELRPTKDGRFGAKLTGVKPSFYGDTLEEAACECLCASQLAPRKLRHLRLQFDRGYRFHLHICDARMWGPKGRISLTRAQRDAFRRLTWIEAVEMASQYAKQHHATGEIGGAA